jgi:hypothetical protein
MLPNVIYISGNIGAGKSTLMEKMYGNKATISQTGACADTELCVDMGQHAERFNIYLERVDLWEPHLTEYYATGHLEGSSPRRQLAVLKFEIVTAMTRLDEYR